MSATGGEPLIVIGGGGHAKVVVALAQALGRTVEAVYDDDRDKEGETILDVPVVTEMPDELEGRAAIVAVGHNRNRARLADQHDLPFATLVHPEAWVAPDVELGPGTVVFAGAVIQPGARLGEHVIVNTGATVDHDCRIGDFSHLAPGVHLAGEVRVGEGAFLGIGSAVINRVRIGVWATLGAGAVAIRDVPAGATAVGVPARSSGGDA